MKKYWEVGLFAFVLCGMVAVANAGSGVRGAKAVKVISQSTTAAPIISGPATVYSIVLGTGAVTDFVVLLDSANATAGSSTSQSTSNGFRGRFHASSATQNTTFLFDPPMFFANGLTAINATAVMTTGITYQPGKALSGE